MILAEKAIQILQDPLINKINFSMDGITINPVAFASVRNDLASGNLKIIEDPIRLKQYNVAMAYLMLEKTILIQDASWLNGHVGKAAIVHECTHHATLQQRLCVSDLLLETTAYVAQIIYALAHTNGEYENHNALLVDPRFDNYLKLRKETVKLIKKYDLLNTQSNNIEAHPEFKELLFKMYPRMSERVRIADCLVRHYYL